MERFRSLHSRSAEEDVDSENYASGRVVDCVSYRSSWRSRRFYQFQRNFEIPNLRGSQGFLLIDSVRPPEYLNSLFFVCY